MKEHIFYILKEQLKSLTDTMSVLGIKVTSTRDIKNFDDYAVVRYKATDGQQFDLNYKIQCLSDRYSKDNFYKVSTIITALCGAFLVFITLVIAYGLIK